jgi:4-amino-4-deoxy-L-arabinose transferase-like glycosyltransferase
LPSHHAKSLLAAGNRPRNWSLPQIGVAGRVAILAALTLFHIWLACYLPPADDELYYWSWAQTLQSSYFDHPPMVAYFIRASTAIFGDSVFAIRLPAIVVSLGVFIALLFLAARGNLVWALLFCPLAFLGSVLMTPDIPLVLFWTLYALWFAWTNATLDGWNSDPVTRVYQSSPVSLLSWILGGCLLGFGGLSKYTMLLAVPCGLTVLATRTRLRAWGPGYLLHLLVAGALVLPVFLYNWHNHFAPLHFQWAHAMAAVAGFSMGGWMRFIGGQILLLGALPFVLFPWILVRFRDLCADAKSHAYFCFFVLPFLFFLYKALTARLEGNWALVAYITFWPVADRLLSWTSFRGPMRVLVILSFVTPWVVSALVLIHLFHPFSLVEPRHDRVSVLRGQLATAQEIAADYLKYGTTEPLLSPNYQWTAYFRFLKIPSSQLSPMGRESQYTMGVPATCEGPAAKAAEVYYIDNADIHPPALSCFTQREILKQYLVLSRGQEVSRVWLTRYKH